MKQEKHPNRATVVIGEKYHRLTIVEDLGSKLINGFNRTIVRSMCDCGNEYIGVLTLIKRGAVKSCGCFLSESSSQRGITRMTTHGLSKHPLYKVLDGIIQRCTNPNANEYEHYGGKGVFVCDEWRNDFMSFYNWAIMHGWRKGLQIDREKNDDGYYPDNCRIVSSAVNNRNKKTNINLTFNNQTKCLTDWAKDLNISYHTLSYRIFKGKWPLDVALTKPKCTKYVDRHKVS